MDAPFGPIRLAIVVAATLKNGIGRGGALPWRLPRDMAYFRAVTAAVCATPDEDAAARRAGRVPSGITRKNAVIMGRNTWESIPPRFRPLGARINIIVGTRITTDDLGLHVADPDTLVVPSFEAAVSVLLARREARYTSAGAPPPSVPSSLANAFIIGGAALYRYVLTRGSGPGWSIDALLMTRIMSPDVECDTFFEEFRTPAQVAWESELAKKCIDTLPSEPMLCPRSVDEGATWHTASPEEHRAYVGQVSQADEAGHIFHDRGHACQFQLWRRRSGA